MEIQYYTDYEAKHLILEAGRRAYARGFVSGNEGNISCRVGKNAVWITPTGQSKGYLNEQMLVKLDLDGNKLGGELDASSEALMHLGVYKTHPGIRVVFHAHPSTATAFSCCVKEIPADLHPETIATYGRTIKVIPFGMPGSSELPTQVTKYVIGNRAALLENHGALTWGEDMKTVYFTMETLEAYCNLYLKAHYMIGGEHSISESAFADLNQWYEMMDEELK